MGFIKKKIYKRNKQKKKEEDEKLFFIGNSFILLGKYGKIAESFGVSGSVLVPFFVSIIGRDDERERERERE